MTDQSGAAVCLEVLGVACSCRHMPHKSSSHSYCMVHNMVRKSSSYSTLQTCCSATCQDASSKFQMGSLELIERSINCRQVQMLPPCSLQCHVTVATFLPDTQQVLPSMATKCMPAVNERSMACTSACACAGLLI